MLRKFLLFVLSIVAATHVLAAEDFQRHVLTVPMLEKFDAAMAEANKIPSMKGGMKDDDSSGDLTTDDLARKLDSNPAARPILAKYGFTARTFALTFLAYMNAAMYLGFEPDMDKKGAAELLASYPREMRANIELLRRNPKFMDSK